MAEFHTAARVGDIPEGGGRPVRVGDRTIAIFNLGGEYCAIDNTCPHRGASLGDGALDGETVICPFHGWEFNVRTGRMAMDLEGVRTYPVRVRGEEIQVEC